MSYSSHQAHPEPPAEAPRQIDPAGEYQPPPRMQRRWLFEDQIAANTRGTVLLMIVFSLLLILIVWGASRLVEPGYAYILATMAAILAFFLSYYSFYHSDQLVLSMSGAVPVSKEQYPHLVNTLEGLTLAAGLPFVPKAYVIDDPAPNAFATGRDAEHSAIAVTTGLLQKLNRYQLEGVLAHELSHVADRDILLSTVAAILVGMIVLLSDWVLRSMWFGGGRRDGDNDNEDRNTNAILTIIALIAVILSPVIAQLLQLAISRKREYLADANGVKLTRYPDGLAGALEVIATDGEALRTANKATAHLFIANPLEDHGGWLNSLFSTHPPIQDRIARLQSM